MYRKTTVARDGNRRDAKLSTGERFTTYSVSRFRFFYLPLHADRLQMDSWCTFESVETITKLGAVVKDVHDRVESVVCVLCWLVEIDRAFYPLLHQYCLEPSSQSCLTRTWARATCSSSRPSSSPHHCPPPWCCDCTVPVPLGASPEDYAIQWIS